MPVTQNYMVPQLAQHSSCHAHLRVAAPPGPHGACDCPLGSGGVDFTEVHLTGPCCRAGRSFLTEAEAWTSIGSQDALLCRQFSANSKGHEEPGCQEQAGLGSCHSPELLPEERLTAVWSREETRTRRGGRLPSGRVCKSCLGRLYALHPEPQQLWFCSPRCPGTARAP